MQKKCFPILLSTNEEAARTKETTLHFNAKGKLTYYPGAVSHTVIQHLYICSTDEIKEGDWKYCSFTNEVTRYDKFAKVEGTGKCECCRKIIATTDSSLHCSGLRREGASCEKNNNCTYPICGGAIAKIPQAFIHSYIEMYNKGEQLKECLVEYERKLTSENGKLSFTDGEFIEKNKIEGLGREIHKHSFSAEDILKLNGNEIIITNNKENWTKDEVEAIKRDAFAKGQEVESLLRRGFAAEGLRIKFDFFKDI